jgi:hypothetical protein
MTTAAGERPARSGAGIARATVFLPFHFAEAPANDVAIGAVDPGRTFGNTRSVRCASILSGKRGTLHDPGHS